MQTKSHYRKDCPHSAGTSPCPDQNMQSYSPPSTVKEMVTASYAAPQSSLANILKELAKVKQTN